jgi:hypothetical protein
MSLAPAGESSGRFDVGQEAELCAPLPPRPAPGGAPPLHEITSCRYRMRIATRRILHMRQGWMPTSSLAVSSESRHGAFILSPVLVLTIDVGRSAARQVGRHKYSVSKH